MTTLLPINTSMPSLGDTAPDASAANTYTDVTGLEALKRDPNSPQAINAVAQQVEALFLQMMLKSMRDASAADSTDSNEMGMYQDMFDKQVALSISQHGDLGIGRLLKRQLEGRSSAGSALKIGSSLPTAPIAQTPADFVNRMMPSIRRAATALGVDPHGMLAQAALETGWGQRMPRNSDGSPSNNLFGIKAGDEWPGPKATADTMEVVNGVAVQRRTNFRAYGTVEESVNDFANLLKSSPRYRDVIASGGNAAGYVQSMGKSGYATDPDYGNKLNQILRSDALQSAVSPRVAAL
jgi:peptidoglycan hydrolase FlgJ